MAADFDAGSIEATLDLNTKPFYAGLRRARMEAERFEKDRITPDIGANDAEFQTKRRRVEKEASALDNRRVRMAIGLSGAERTLRQLERVQDKMRALRRERLKGLGQMSMSGLRGLVSPLTVMVGLVGSLGPMMVSLVSTVGLFGVAGAAAFGGALLPLGLFMGLVGGAVGKIAEATAAGEQLAGAAGRAQNAFKGLKKEWERLREGAGAFELLEKTFRGLERLMPKLHPLMATTFKALENVGSRFGRLFESDRFTKFLGQLEPFMDRLIRGFGRFAVLLTKTFMNVFDVLSRNGIFAMMGGWFLDMARGMERATSEGGKFEQWVKRTKEDLPVVADFLNRVGNMVKFVATHLPELAAAFILVKGAAITATIAMQAFNLSNPVGWVIIAVNALVYLGLALGVLSSKYEGLRGVFTGFWNGIKSVVGPAVEYLKAAIGRLGEAFGGAGTNMETLQNAARGLGVLLGALVAPTILFVGALTDVVAFFVKANTAFNEATEKWGVFGDVLRWVKDRLLDLLFPLRPILRLLEHLGIVSKGAADEVEKLGEEQATAARETEKHKKSLTDLANEMLRAREANRAWIEAMVNGRNVTKENGRVVDEHGRILAGQRDKFLESQRALDQNAQAWLNLDAKQRLAPGTMRKTITSLQEQMTVMGYGRAEIARYISKITGIPPKKVAEIITKGLEARAGVVALRDAINSLKSKTVWITARVTHAGSLGSLANANMDYLRNHLGNSSGGYIHGPGTAISDSIPRRLSRGEYVVRASAVKRFGRGFFDSLNSLGEPQGSRAPSLRRAAGSAISSSESREQTALLRAILTALSGDRGFDMEEFMSGIDRLSKAQSRESVRALRAAGVNA